MTTKLILLAMLVASVGMAQVANSGNTSNVPTGASNLTTVGAVPKVGPAGSLAESALTDTGVEITVRERNIVSAGVVPIPQRISLTIPFAAVASTTILGTQTLMASPLVTCVDTAWVALACTNVQTVNALNPNYSDIVVSFTGSQSGRVIVTGTQSFLWYVDSINGSDSNAGTSPATAFKTIAKVMLQPQLSGFNVGLAANSRWRESLTLSALYSSAQSYGVGEKPLLDASDAISAGSWTKTGGQTYVYQITGSISNGGFAFYTSVWENGVRLARASSVANCNSTAGTYFPSDESAGVTAPIIYIHAPDGSSPITNGKTYEYSSRGGGISTGNNATVRGVWARRNAGFSGSIITQVSGLVMDSLAQDGNIHNVYVAAGSVLYNVEAQRYQYTVGGSGNSMFVYYDAAPADGNVIFDSCWAHSDAAPLVLSGGFYGHAAAGAWGTAYFVGNRADGFVTAYGGANIANMSWILNKASQCGACYDGHSATASIVATNNSVTDGAGIVLWATAPAVTVTGMLASITNGNGVPAFTFSGNSAVVSVTGSTVISQMNTTAMVADASNSVNMTLTGNKWSGAYLFYNFTGATITLTSDNNVFSSEGPGGTAKAMYVDNTAYATVAAYQLALTLDGASTVTTRTNLNNWSNDIVHGISITGWSKAKGDVALAVAPDGTLTATSFTEDATSGTHWLTQGPTVTNASHSYVSYVKPNGRTWVYFSAEPFAAYFQLVGAGVVGTTVGTPTSAAITNVGNGWYKLKIVGTPASGVKEFGWYLATGDGTGNYSGDGVSGIIVWHPQLNLGAEVAYQVQP